MKQGVELRDKAKGLVDLLQDSSKLQYEREFAKQTREKFSGIQGSVSSDPTQNVMPSSAGPASGTGSKYGGFGSQDIANAGFNNKDQFGANGAYDPYTRTQATDTAPVKEKKEKETKKTAKLDESDEDSTSSLDSDADSDDSDVKRKKEKLKKKLEKQAKKKEHERKKKEKEEGKTSEVAPVPATGGAGLLMAPKASRTFNGTIAPVAPQQ